MSDQGKSPKNQLNLTGSHNLAVKKADHVKCVHELKSTGKKQTLNVLIGDMSNVYETLSDCLFRSVLKDKYELNLTVVTTVEEVMEHSLKGDIDIFVLILNNLTLTRGIEEVIQMLFEIKQTHPRPIISLSGYFYLEDPSIIDRAIFGSDYFFPLPFSYSDFMESFEICLAMLPYYKGDFSKAFLELLPFAQNGDAKAQFMLGCLYANGQGVSQDYGEAVKWFRKAADKGHTGAQSHPGAIYLKGQGVPENYEEVLKWSSKAAEQDHIEAQYRVGLMCVENRFGGEKEAPIWWRKAAEQGHANAQYNLGYIYNSGRGVSQDYTEALKWYTRAAEQGNEQAQNNLGFIYSIGMGVPRDYVQAYNWYCLSAAHGRELAAKNRDAIAREMTPDQVAEAQILATEWFKEHNIKK